MKKIKKIWQENKVLLVLAIILIVCLVIFGLVALKYFYGSGSDVYGNRLDEIKDVKLSEKLFTDIKEELKKDEKVNDVSIILKGKIVYITIKYNKNVKIDDAKKIAEETLKLFNDNELAVYDIEYSISSDSDKDDGYIIMGARNANGSGKIVWNNYNMENIKKESAE